MAKAGDLQRKITERLKAMRKKYEKSGAVTVGYNAPYAIYVHENLEVDHPEHIGPGGEVRDCGGQAKFLTQPLHENRHKYKAIVKVALQQGATPIVAGMRAGRALLADSQLLVPVDSGFLKSTGFVKAGSSTDLVDPEGGIGVHVPK